VGHLVTRNGDIGAIIDIGTSTVNVDWNYESDISTRDQIQEVTLNDLCLLVINDESRVLAIQLAELVQTYQSTEAGTTSASTHAGSTHQDKSEAAPAGGSARSNTRKPSTSVTRTCRRANKRSCNTTPTEP